MTTFQTKVRDRDDNIVTVQPEREPLCKVSDNTDCNHYYYRDEFATVEDVSKPGFFNFMRDTFRSGAKRRNTPRVVHMIMCDLGEVTEGLTRIDLHVVEAPSAFDGPVTMAVGTATRFKPTAKTDKGGSK